ncbi:NAD(P)-binding domain-containing protein [Paraburkholderia sp. GAS334]|uniref:NAD(P)-binding domain-containing protein n=1 Tax=Paraburkholderia sp. GAS334 TaxID=3035131 RepID=UPI003D1D969C
MSEAIGFVGLGMMGASITDRLMAAGYEVIVYDRSAERARFVIASVPDAEASRDVTVGGEGIIHGQAVSYYIETSTIGPGACREIAAQLQERPIEFVDAPVSGGPRGITRGNLFARPVVIATGRMSAIVSTLRPLNQNLGV